MGLHVSARLVKVELGQRRIVRTGTGEKNVINPSRQLVEEALQLSEVGSVKGRAVLCAKLARCALKGLRIPGREDELRSPSRASRAVSRPMPALPPITTTVWPRSCGSRCAQKDPVARAHNSSDRLSKCVRLQ